MSQLWMTVYCALVVIAYFLLVWGKNKLADRVPHRFATIVSIILDVLIFGAFLLGLAGITGFNFETLGPNLKTVIEQQGMNIVWTLITIIIGTTFYNIVRGIVHFRRKKSMIDAKRQKTISKVIMSLTKYFIVIVDVIVILKIWGMDILPALAGVGIAGLVIGLGVQKFINDFVSGTFIIFERHFDVGDIIEVDNFKGEVIDIGLKTTRIRNYLGQVKVIANGELTNIINDSIYNTVLDLHITFAYKENIESVMKLLDVELAKRFAGYEDIVIPPHCIGVQELGASGVTIRVNTTTKPEQQHDIGRKMRQVIKEIFEENNVEIPYNKLVIIDGKDNG